MTKFPRPRFASEFGFQSYPSFNSLAGISNPVVSVGRGREGRRQERRDDRGGGKRREKRKEGGREGGRTEGGEGERGKREKRKGGGREGGREGEERGTKRGRSLSIINVT